MVPFYRYLTVPDQISMLIFWGRWTWTGVFFRNHPGPTFNVYPTRLGCHTRGNLGPRSKECRWLLLWATLLCQCMKLLPPAATTTTPVFFQVQKGLFGMATAYLIEACPMYSTFLWSYELEEMTPWHLKRSIMSRWDHTTTWTRSWANVEGFWIISHPESPTNPTNWDLPLGQTTASYLMRQGLRLWPPKKIKNIWLQNSNSCRVADMFVPFQLSMLPHVFIIPSTELVTIFLW